jgi:hypothetical protein
MARTALFVGGAGGIGEHQARRRVRVNRLAPGPVGRLCSPAAASVTGATIDVNGRRWMG